ncbi:hypothetical protein ACFOZ0_21650 [Streptomyces yaanensis]|uniref:Fibrillarin n=1 Tax=Streptomyces yaanensis TaxID=1142239 RepID=A0ABV7SGU5_9ACTN|nr:hypothetical protein [Streptomyces sp. CGMCC 4.7035]WNB97562.1 hypothetical protein Q2K21_05440 [Streptomyces sp. CGMCC 4.7035]
MAAVGVAATGQGQTSTADLVLPLIAAVAAVAVAVYASLRRRRRMTTRTTPGGATPTVVSLDELDRRARRSLVETDDCVRTSREELRCVAAQLGDVAVRLHAEAVEFAAAELSAAFRARQRLDDGEGATRTLLEEILARCEAAGRRLDEEAAGLDRTRALERTVRDALEHAEARFRELAARIADADGTLVGLRERYALSAYLPVAGHDEQAKDRLVFTMTCLNRSRQDLDRGDTQNAVVHLRAAEAAVDQAALLVDGIARLAAALATATERLPTALTDTESALAEAREQVGTESARGDLRGRIAYGESVLAGVRSEMGGERTTGADANTGGKEPGGGDRTEGGEDTGEAATGESGADTRETTGETGAHTPETTGVEGADSEGGCGGSGQGEVDRRRMNGAEGARGGRRARDPYDPVDALRRIEQVAVGLDRALWREPPGGSHALGRLERALLTARCTVGAASDYVTTHRGAIGCEARTRLAEAERRLRDAENTDVPPVPSPADALTDAREADALARQARQLAERDVRAYGTPYGEGLWTGGAVLGGILLDASHRRAEGPGHPGDGGPASYGGPDTRGRRDGGELFRPRPARPGG